jgi:S-(hydroxymethyl)glutathione dehydrogenase/alcohol dehydrogenase
VSKPGLRFQAAVLEKNKAPLALREIVFKGPLKKGQVLARVHYSGVCGKQVEEILGSRGPDKFLPHMLGHEGSGEVLSVGPGVKKVRAGDRVVLHWVKGKGLDAETPRYESGGVRVNAGWVTTFNEYAVVSENRVTKIPAAADLEIACLLGCAATTGVGVILNEAKVEPGESVAIFGCGGVGLMAVQGARLAKAGAIVALDKNADSLALAKKFGAHHRVDMSRENAVERVRALTGGKGARHVIVCTGNAAVVETAVEASAVPGGVFFVGVPPAGAKITIDPFKIHCQRALTGSFGGGCLPDRDIPLYLKHHARGKLALDAMIAQTVPLARINEAIDALLSGATGRWVVKMV